MSGWLSAAGISATAANVAITGLVGGIVALGGTWLYNQITAGQKLSEKVETLTSDYRQSISELTSHSAEFETLAQRYVELGKGVDALGKNVSLTDDEFSEYQSTVSKIANYVPNLVRGFDDTNTAILTEKDNVESLTGAYNDLIVAKYDSELSNASDIFNDFSNKRFTYEHGSFLRFTSDSVIESRTYDILDQLLHSSDINETWNNLGLGNSNTDYLHLLSLIRKAVTQNSGESNVDYIRRALLNENNRIGLEALVSKHKSDAGELIDGITGLASAYLEKRLLTDKNDLPDETKTALRDWLESLDYSFYYGFNGTGEIFDVISNKINEFENTTGLSSGDMSESIEEVSESIASVNDELASLGITLESAAESFDNFYDALKASNTETGLTAEQVANLKDRYKDLEGFDVGKLFEASENGIHLNAQALGELESALENQQRSNIDNYLKSLVKQYNDLTAQINKASTAAERNELIRQRDELKAEIDSTRTLAIQYDGLTSSYNKWKKAQSIGEEGDMYDDVTSSLEDIKELYDQGLIGTNKFRSAVQMMTNADVTGLNPEDLVKIYDESYPKMQRYFQDGVTGVNTFLEDVNKLDSRLAHLNEKGEWEFDFSIVGSDGKSGDAYIAEQLDISTDAVQMILRKLKDYGFKINLESIFSDLDLDSTDFETAFEEIDAKIEAANEAFEQGAIKVEEYNEQVEQLTAARDTLELFSDEDIVDFNTITLDEALEKIEVLTNLMETGINVPVNITGQYQELVDYITQYNRENPGVVPYEILVALNGLTEAEEELDGINDSRPVKYEAEADGEKLTQTTNALTAEAHVRDVDYKPGVDPETLTAVSDTLDDLARERQVTFTPKSSGTGFYGEDGKENNLVARFVENGLATLEEAATYVGKIAAQGRLDSALAEDIDWSNFSSGQEAYEHFTGTAQKVNEVHENVREMAEETSQLLDEAAHTADELSSAIDNVQGETEEITIDDGVIQDLAKASGELYRLGSELGLPTESLTALNDAFIDFQFAVGALKNSDDSSIAGLTDEFVAAASAFNSAYDQLYQAIAKKQTVTIDANVAPAKTAISSLGREPVTVSVFGKVVNAFSSLFGGHASGTNNAPGGTSIVDELGAELIEHKKRGTFELGTNAGARLTELDKGDIVHTAQETRGILSRFGALFGRAYENGSSGSGPSFFSKLVAASKASSSTSSSASTSSSRSNPSSKDDESNTSLFDWIEVAIERIEQLINNLSRTANSAFRHLTNRLSATSDEISKVGGEIQIQEEAYARYLQQAESIALDENLKRMVRNGMIDIREYDEEVQGLIEDYQQWYSRALSCADAVDELSETMAELYQSRFDMIQTDFNNQLSLMEHMTTSYNNGLEMIEERGYIGGMKFYQEMRAIEQQNIETQKQELAGLTQAMSDALNSGAVEMYSEAWYSMQQEINGVKESIQESELALVKFDNSIRSLHWEVFDYTQERIGDIITESEFLINLLNSSKLFDDRGQLTGTGKAQMGLHTMNYNVYMEQADQYAEEMRKINAALAKDPNNKTLIDRRRELLKLQRDSIAAAESEKSAVADMVENGINLELGALKELIDAYEESLDSSRDLFEYQKKVNKQTKEITDLQKQLAAFAGDTSEENRARIQKLNVSLSDAMESLNETQYDQYIKDQKQLLDSLYEDYSDLLNARLDDIDKLMNDMIDATNTNATEIKDVLTAETSAVGYTPTEEMKSIWGTDGVATSVVSTYGNNITSGLTTINTTINGIAGDVAKMVKDGDDIADDIIAGTTPSTPTVPSSPTPTPSRDDVPVNDVPHNPSGQTAESASDASSKSDSSGSGKTVRVSDGSWYVRSAASMSGSILGVASGGNKFAYTGKTQNGFNGIIYKGQNAWISTSGSKIVGYSDGGIIGGLQKVAMRNGDDMITVNTLKKGEGILTPEQAVQFKNIADHLPLLQGIVDSSAIFGQIKAGLSAGDGNTNVAFGDINISIEHVQDYNDFVRQLQSDDKFERMIQDMTVNRLAGKSMMAKRNYKWN